jgi:hypothetical protein
MDKVTVQKDELLARLEANRENHRDTFVKACEVYNDRLRRELEDHLARVAKGELVRVQIPLPTPEEHTADYDAAIEMLKMEVNDTVEIHDTVFRNLVMDEWEWTRRFAANTSSYLVG